MGESKEDLLAVNDKMNLVSIVAQKLFTFQKIDFLSISKMM